MPELPQSLQKSLKRTSSLALKISIPNNNPFDTNTDTHNKAKRSLPYNVTLYRHALLLYKLFNSEIPSLEHFHLNFQLSNNERSDVFVFVKSQNYFVGRNILINRLVCLNNTIKKDWMTLSLDSYKVMCKKLFLS